MKVFLNILGILLAIFGLVWFLQGVNILPGSFMTGQIRWAVYGGIALASGVTILAKTGIRTVIVNTIATVVLVLGTIWFLQGINILPGSFMTGQLRWAINGGIANVVPIIALLLNNRKRTAGRS